MVGEPQLRARDTHDGVRLVVDDHKPAEDRRIGAILIAPKPVAEHHRAVGAFVALVTIEESTNSRRGVEEREQRRGDSGAHQAYRLVANPHAVLRRWVSGDSIQRAWI